MSQINDRLGVPTGARTVEGFQILAVTSFHNWLCDNELEFETFMNDLFVYIRNISIQNVESSVTDENASANDVLLTNV